MNKQFVKYFFLPSIVLASFCSQTPPSTIQKVENPKTILHPTPLGDSGLITRKLFRSFWTLPSSDQDLIRIGIIPTAKKIRLTASKHFIIRVYDEHESWDVASPGGVVWEFQVDSIVRPPVLRYLLTVDERDVSDVSQIPAGLEKKWTDRGFVRPQWLGPPKMDSYEDDKKLKRFFLTLKIEESRERAQEICKQIAKQYFNSCNVITRMDLPHISKGIFRAQQSNFEKEFEGIIEIIPAKKDAIQIFDVKTSLLSENTETLAYSPQIFVVPNLDNELSVVQTTSLDQYLKSVVPSEIYPNAPLEALKAQAVIARTYLFQSKLHYSDKPFLTCASTLCQVYLGEKTKNQSSNIGTAVDKTHNVVLRESPLGLFAETFYHGASGGKTEAKQTIMGGAPKPYLVSTNDMLASADVDLKRNEKVDQFLRMMPPTYCSISRFSKNINWTHHFDEQEIASTLAKLKLQPPLRSISVRQRGISGRVLAIDIVTATQRKTVTGDLNIRSLFGGLPSSLVVFHPIMIGSNVRSLTISGRGSGHGVGLSQMGAIGRALEGQSYTEILSSYYPGTVLTYIEPE